MNARVAVIVVNYRTARLVSDCLRSLAGEAAERIVVVDNASDDGTADELSTACAAVGAEFLPLDRNAGFAAGNNAALRRILASADQSSRHAPSAVENGTRSVPTTLPDYLLLLNPDTVVRPGAVAALADFLDAHPKAGIAGSRLENPDGTPQRSAFRFPSVAGEFENGMRLGVVSKLLAKHVVAPPVRGEAHRCDWVSGASLMVRRAVFEQIGLMDEGFFLYFEEVDFCRRAADAGWQCWYVPTSRVVHFVSASTGVDAAGPRKRTPTYWFASRRRYWAKHFYRRDALLANALWATGRAGWQLRRKPAQDPPHLLGDFVRYNLWESWMAAEPDAIQERNLAHE
ncbi:MAG: glycosyltransferase family 2 protein [Gemmataceae bacterium]